MSNYSAQQGDVQAKAIEYSAVDPADLRVPPSDPRFQPKSSIHGESTVDSFVPPLDPLGLESDLFSTPPSSYVLELEEQDYYGFGPDDCFTFTNENLQDIYSSHCQSEVESYIMHLGTATLQSQLDHVHQVNPEYSSFTPNDLQDLFMEKYVHDYCMETFATTWQDEFINDVSVTDQEYFFKVEEDQQVLDSINIVQGPDIVFATGQDGKSVPLAMIIIQVRSIQGKGTARYFRALLDTGSNVSLAHSRVLL